MWACVLTALSAFASRAQAIQPSEQSFRTHIRPLLETRCFDCHGDGAKKGGVAFDGFASDSELLADKELWFRVLKNVRGGLMPPPKKDQPTPEQRQQLAGWIKAEVFQLDPNRPDPGRVVLRRLNRIEYRNTVRDLTGVDFRTDEEFPADDTGHGFDNIGEVLTLPTMLLEKYLAAAKSIVQRAVPPAAFVMPEQRINGDQFFRTVKNGEEERRESMSTLSYYDPLTVSADVTLEHPGRYTVVFDFSGQQKYVEGEADRNKCRLILKADGEELKREDFSTASGRHFTFDFSRDWLAGRHQLSVEIEPLTPEEKQVRSLALRLDSVTVRGPDDKSKWRKAPNHERWFAKEIPADAAGRRAYASGVLSQFSSRAFRRPVDDATVARLADLTERIYSEAGQTFEAGVSRSMEAVLASPRFLFREEPAEPLADGQSHPFVDEYALASRLSYFLWSTMPDEELMRLAGEKKLRVNLAAQFKRLFDDERSQGFVGNFAGQWLQSRDIEGVPIDARFVLRREEKPDPEFEKARQRMFELRRKDTAELTPEEKEELEKGRSVFRRNFDRFKNAEFSGAIRRDMRRETEKYFEFVIREDRPLLELIDSDYTFLNERLAKHYGLPDMEGDDLRRVVLPADNPRGGILTQGTVLAVTSNPTRTSPVKRGLFILENFLGSPPPPPPANVPPLEDSSRGRGFQGTLRENLARHREDAQCASCHNRMDPLGLALENFNAMGRWRDFERGQPVDAGGQLVSGEKFSSARELKRILATNHRDAFLRCLTEKMLTYALGRGLDYRDETTVDQILERIEKSGGRARALLTGIVESDAFLKRRAPNEEKTVSR